MPSPLYVPVTTITSITSHSNADTLEIAQVLGWQCVVPRGKYAAGDRVIYFPIDTLLPREQSDAWGITSYLDHQRIKATRLRGEPSFGLVMPCACDDWQIGENVADYYGVTKYEPPVRGQRTPGGQAIANPYGLPHDPLFPEYTHIANLRHYPDIFSLDELVVYTEKLHCTSSRIGMVNGQWMAGSHRVRRSENDELYWSPREHVQKLVEALAQHHRQVIVFGEILGSGVQSLDYGYQGHAGYRVFDLMIDGRYVDFGTFRMLCAAYGVNYVPVYYIGLFDFNFVSHYAQGKTYLRGYDDNAICTGDHLREGVIVKPLIERTDPRVGRMIMKYVSDAFLLAKKTDFSEV